MIQTGRSIFSIETVQLGAMGQRAFASPRLRAELVLPFTEMIQIATEMLY